MLPFNLPFLLLFLSPLISFLFARTIDFPVDVNGESITHLRGSLFLMTDIPTGDVHLVDTRTDITARVIRAPPNRSAFGLAVDANSRVFIAGVGPGLASFASAVLGLDFSNITASIHVYDLPTGADVASCLVPNASLVNDVAIAGRFAYFTDSLRPFLYRLDIDGLPDCRITKIGLDETVFGGDGFRGNGIAAFQGGLIVGNSMTSTVYFVDLKRGGEMTQVLQEGAIPIVGGLRISNVKGRRLLFAAQDTEDPVAVFRLGFKKKERRVVLKNLVNVTNPAFVIPSSVGVSADAIMVPNLNVTAINIGDPFTVTVVRLDDFLPFA